MGHKRRSSSACVTGGRFDTPQHRSLICATLLLGVIHVPGDVEARDGALLEVPLELQRQYAAIQIKAFLQCAQENPGHKLLEQVAVALAERRQLMSERSFCFAKPSKELVRAT